jgi:hypothetical protein
LIGQKKIRERSIKSKSKPLWSENCLATANSN